MLKRLKKPAVRLKKCWSCPNNDVIFCGAGGVGHLARYLGAEVLPVVEDHSFSVCGADIGKILYFADVWRAIGFCTGFAGMDLASGGMVVCFIDVFLRLDVSL